MTGYTVGKDDFISGARGADVIVFDPKFKFTSTQKKLRINVDYMPPNRVAVGTLFAQGPLHRPVRAALPPTGGCGKTGLGQFKYIILLSIS